MSRSYHYDCDFFQGEGVFILKKEDENEQVKVKTFFLELKKVEKESSRESAVFLGQNLQNIFYFN